MEPRLVSVPEVGVNENEATSTDVAVRCEEREGQGAAGSADKAPPPSSA